MSDLDNITKAVRERILAAHGLDIHTSVITVVVDALIGLHIIHTETPLRDADTAARHLAAVSGHPRYTSGDGWRRLLTSDSDMAAAYSLAVRACAGDADATRHCATARTILNEHHRSSAPT